jgi:hypothetical protein
MTTNVLLPYIYIADPTKARPVFNGQIFLGVEDLDPELNPVQAYVLEENGTLTPITQPILTGAGGVPMYNGSAAIIAVDDNYSMRVLDDLGSQIYYVANGLEGETGSLNATYIPRAGTPGGPDITGPLVWVDSVSGKRFSISEESEFHASLLITKVEDTENGSIIIGAWDGNAIAYYTTFRADGQVVLPENVDYSTISQRSAVPKLYIDDGRAFGAVDSDGTKLGGSPNWSSARIGLGQYQITFDVTGAGTPFDQYLGGQLSGLGAGQFLNAAMTNDGNNDIGNVVLFVDDGSTPVDEAFTFLRVCEVSTTFEP